MKTTCESVDVMRKERCSRWVEFAKVTMRKSSMRKVLEKDVKWS